MTRIVRALLLAGLACAGTAGAVARASETAPARAPFGIDLSAQDRATRPGDDFFRFVNGGWYDRRAFAPDEIYVGARADLAALRRTRVRAIIEEASRGAEGDPVARIVGPFYASFMDEAAIDRAGIDAIRPELDTIAAAGSHDDLFRLFARSSASGLPSPISGTIFYDFHEPGRMRFTITPGGLGLSSRELYLGDDANAVRVRAAYRDYVIDMLRTVGVEDPEARADVVIAFERRIAEQHWPGAQARDFLLTSNSLTTEELAALTPDFDWTAYLTEAGVGAVDKVIVSQPSAMAPLIAALRETPVDVVRDWMRFRLVGDFAPYLSSAIAQRAFAFNGRTLSGQQEPAARWQRGVDLVERYFGFAVGQLYVQRHFSESSRRAVEDMFGHIRAEMRDRIVRASWMSDTTRAEALRKIDTINVKIGYPSRWPAYEGLTFRPDALVANLRQARTYWWRQRTNLALRPLDRDEWMTTPQTTGAAANPNLNEITVPAGALEPPFFDPAADAAVNYGAIGGVLGHELSHMFDQLGRQMDATGALRDWWAPEDSERYQAIASRVAGQYDAFEALPGLHVGGRITLNENIADIAGLTLAQAAYHRSLRGRPGRTIGGYTPDQRLFLGWAQMRAGKMRDEMLRQQVATGPHAPDYFRVNGVVRNIDAWYRAFNIGPNDRLYLAPQDRAQFW